MYIHFNNSLMSIVKKGVEVEGTDIFYLVLSDKRKHKASTISKLFISEVWTTVSIFQSVDNANFLISYEYSKVE